MRDRTIAMHVHRKTIQCCLTANAMLLIIFAPAFSAQFASASNVPSASPAQQQQPNPAPVPESHLRFPAGITKNSNSDATADSETGDSSICFPYFISQDIEALLAQAIRMLDRAADDRQKGWLLIFVQKLDSLSRQLRSLPVKHENMCFQSRDDAIQGDRSLYDADDDDILSAIPDDIQLHYAKRLFSGGMEPPKQRGGREIYVTGKVYERNTLNIPRSSSKRYHVPSHHQPDITRMETTPAGRDIQIQEGHSNVFTTSQPSVVNPNPRNPGNYLYRETVPIGYWPGPSMTYENMPFLPRSTRKTIPRPLIDKLKYRPHLSDKGSPQETIDGQLQPASTSHPVTTTVAQTQTRSDDSLNSGTAAEVPVVPEKPDVEQREATRELVRIPLTSTAQSNSPTVTNAKQEPVPSPEIRHEESVMKTSSSEGPSRNDFQKLPDGGNEMDEKRKQPIPSNDHSNSQESSQESVLNQNEEPKNGQKVMNDRGQYVEYPSSYGKYEDYRPAPHKPSYNYDNNLDFEYEEQGAAAGELYNADDENTAKLLALPPAGPKYRVAPNGNDLEAADDAVRQLHELRSSSKMGSESGRTNHQTSRVYPTPSSLAEQANIKP